MGKYIKTFSSKNTYNTFALSGEIDTPNISYCTENNEVYYNAENYISQYFTIEALENGSISLNIPIDIDTSYITSISYSTNNGNTWTTINNTNNRDTYLIISVDVNSGDKVLWKGNAEALSDGQANAVFSSTCRFNLYGNIMSLLYGDNFVGETSIPSDAFNGLFRNHNYNGEIEYNELSLEESKVVDASKLILPATTLGNYCYHSMFEDCKYLIKSPILPAMTTSDGCYYNMFRNCISLVQAPELPATVIGIRCYYGMFYGCTNLINGPTILPAATLTSSCYNSMFYNCINLITAPELPATNLSVSDGIGSNYDSMFYNCKSLVVAPNLPLTTLKYAIYRNMFRNCTSLTVAPQLPATTLADSCYDSMFNGCSSLTTPPELPATTLANYCYNCMFLACRSLTTAPELPATTLVKGCYFYMFQGCTSLTVAPELPATTLADSCYYYMFYNCERLITPPELPVTTLANNCYAYMFSDCTSLTTAPELPATTLVYRCYAYMFNHCTNLNYIKAMFTTTPDSSYTSSWVNGVASSGTFVKNSAATWNVTGTNGIPTGWTVETASN